MCYIHSTADPEFCEAISELAREHSAFIASHRPCHMVDTLLYTWEGKCKATSKRELKLAWREAGPPNHHDDKEDSLSVAISDLAREHSAFIASHRPCRITRNSLSMHLLVTHYLCKYLSLTVLCVPSWLERGAVHNLLEAARDITCWKRASARRRRAWSH